MDARLHRRQLLLAATVVVALRDVTPAQVPASQAGRLGSLDLSAGAKNGVQRLAASGWYPVVRVGPLALGIGARASGYAGAPTSYRNRDAQQGRPANLVIDPAIVSVNAAVFGELTLISRVAVGANLDVLGLGIGPAERWEP